MPFVLVAVGLILVITGYQNTFACFGKTVLNDVTGDKNFLTWVLAIGAVGALGYVNELREFSHWFMALIIVSMILSNGGFFQKFASQLQVGPAKPAATSASSDAKVSQLGSETFTVALNALAAGA